MKKAVITLALVLALGTSGVLASCTANTTTGGNATDAGSSTPTETSTEGNGSGNVIDDAESRMEDMSEHATHGVEDGTPGGHSTRGGARMPLMPRGK